METPKFSPIYMNPPGEQPGHPLSPPRISEIVASLPLPESDLRFREQEMKGSRSHVPNPWFISQKEPGFPQWEKPPVWVHEPGTHGFPTKRRPQELFPWNHCTKTKSTVPRGPGGCSELRIRCARRPDTDAPSARPALSPARRRALALSVRRNLSCCRYALARHGLQC